jgi:hypothetical protein
MSNGVKNTGTKAGVKVAGKPGIPTGGPAKPLDSVTIHCPEGTKAKVMTKTDENGHQVTMVKCE